MLFKPQAGWSAVIRGETSAQLYWRGITSIRDLTGTEWKDEAVVTSCSGTDYFQSQEPLAPAVPFGGFVAMTAVIAMLILGGSMARRRPAIPRPD